VSHLAQEEGRGKARIGPSQMRHVRCGGDRAHDLLGVIEKRQGADQVGSLFAIRADDSDVLAQAGFPPQSLQDGNVVGVNRVPIEVEQGLERALGWVGRHTAWRQVSKLARNGVGQKKSALRIHDDEGVWRLLQSSLQEGMLRRQRPVGCPEGAIYRSQLGRPLFDPCLKLGPLST
jgi:hypothetical protein